MISHNKSKAAVATAASSETAMTTVIETPARFDLLSGKDKSFIKHEGNVIFRQLLVHGGYMDRYSSAMKNKREKMKITKEVVHRMKSTYGSRFIKKSQTTGAWEEMSDVAAREKVSHALRFLQRTADKQQQQDEEEGQSTCPAKVMRCHKRARSKRQEAKEPSATSKDKVKEVPVAALKSCKPTASNNNELSAMMLSCRTHSPPTSLWGDASAASSMSISGHTGAAAGASDDFSLSSSLSSLESDASLDSLLGSASKNAFYASRIQPNHHQNFNFEPVDLPASASLPVTSTNNACCSTLANALRATTQDNDDLMMGDLLRIFDEPAAAATQQQQGENNQLISRIGEWRDEDLDALLMDIQ